MTSTFDAEEENEEVDQGAKSEQSPTDITMTRRGKKSGGGSGGGPGGGKLINIFINPVTRRPTNLCYIIVGIVLIWIVYAAHFSGRREAPYNPKLKLGDDTVHLEGFDPDLIPFQHLVRPHQTSGDAGVIPPRDINNKMAPPPAQKNVPADRQNIPRPKPKEFPVDVMFRPALDAVKCPVNHDTYILIAVVSLPAEVTLRNSIRRSWGNPANFDNLRISGLTWRTVFVIGNGNADEDAKIAKENERYSDVLQGKFDDTGVEETRKCMMVFDWVTKDLSKHAGCRPGFVLKTQAKVYIHMPYVLDWIAHTVRDLQNVYRGKILRGDRPIRTSEDPLFVSPDDFAGDTFPDLIRGPVYLFSTDVVERMAERFDTITPIAMEDSYLGLLASDIGVKPVDDDKFLLMQRPRNVCHYKRMMFVYDVAPSEQIHVFNVVERNHMAEECKEREL